MSFTKASKLIFAIAVTLTAFLSSSEIKAQSPGVRSLPAIRSREEFDAISRNYDADTPYPLPHVLFVIDRKANNKIYYVNANRYTFHKAYVNGPYLSLERRQAVY